MDIDQLKLTTSLRDEVERYLGPPADKSGRWLQWHCPFHDDNQTPSFSMRVEDTRWHCFGCGRSGDILDFVQLQENIDLQQAYEQLMAVAPDDPEVRQQMAADRAERIERRLEAQIAEAKQALSELRDARQWVKYHEGLQEHGREWWRVQGIADVWQDLWMLGWSEDNPWGTPTATIPIFEQAEKPTNIKHRLISPNGRGKYRYEIPGLGQPLFRCDPDQDLTGHVIAIEGEKKAMVSYITLDDPRAKVVGYPGLSSRSEVSEKLASAEQVTLVSDPLQSPRQKRELWEMIKAVGRGKVRLVLPPAKIDDLILESDMTKRELRQYLRQAKSLTASQG